MADETNDLGFITEMEVSELDTSSLTEEEKANLSNDGHIDFGKAPETETDKEEKPVKNKDDQPEETVPPVKENEETGPSENEIALQKERDIAEKRRKDTEKSFQAERQKNIKLQAELDRRKTESPRKSVKPKDDADLLFGEDEDGEITVDDGSQVTKDQNGDTEVQTTLEEIKQKQEELEQSQIEAEKQRAIDAWSVAEEKAKVDKADYQEVVYDVFYKAFEASPAVQEKFAAKGSTPEAAYELGLELKKYEDALGGKKPETKIEGDNTADTNKPKEAKLDPTQALRDNSSSTAAKTPQLTNNVVSAVNDALAFL